MYCDTNVLEIENIRVQKALDSLARRIVALKLNMLAVLALELHKPFTTLVYNGCLFLQPLAVPIFGADRLHTLQLALGKRENIEKLINLIETYSNNQEEE
jgi:hypothetical protein